MIRALLIWIATALIRRARRTPYFHLYHADGSLYMGRWWLLRPVLGGAFSVRVHRIATPDYDRDMHDHPWAFVSIVLRGGYTERRPWVIEPDFIDGEERAYDLIRRPSSIALRRPTDRHRIVDVLPDTWSLVFIGPKRHWWGFHTPAGKIHWKTYESVHNNAPTTEAITTAVQTTGA